MRKILCALLVLRVATGNLIITKSMLASEAMEPVLLLTKAASEATGQSSEKPKIRQTPKELKRALGYVEDNDEDFTGRDLNEETTTSTERDDEYYDEEEQSTTPFSLSVEAARRVDVAEPNKTTKLYPVGRLWERTLPPRPMPGIMAVLDAAFSCLWSGLGFECFSLKVVPMFRAMMGFPPIAPFGHPYYVLPRTAEPDQNDVDNEEPTEEGRRRRRHGLKLVKMAMIGLAAMKTFLLPALSLLSLASGKAIIVSMAAVVLTLAFGWSSAKSADRRVYNPQKDPPTYPYYMM